MSNKNEIIDLLKKELTSIECVKESHIIGSFVESENYNDVDLIILFKHQNDLIFIIEKIKSIKEKFKNVHRKSLHVSSFTFGESQYFEQFKSSNSLINL